VRGQSSRIGGHRTLELVFEDYLGVSKARCVAALRFNAVRRELLGAFEDNLCVAGLAWHHGIDMVELKRTP
jgi:transcriptional regulator GlxA family with amidase domain